MLTLTVFNVGQAASSLLQFDDDICAIFDCGSCPTTGFNPLVRRLRELIKLKPSLRIAFVALSHLDLDHISGVAEVLEDRSIAPRIGLVYCNGLEYRALMTVLRRLPRGVGYGFNPHLTSQLRGLRALIRFVSSESRKVGSSRHFEATAPIGSAPSTYPVRLIVPGVPDRFVLELWGPSQRLRDRALSTIGNIETDEVIAKSRNNPDWNTASLVLTVTYSGRRLCLAGDATGTTWAEILLRARNMPKSDVVLCWHHGGSLAAGRPDGHDEHIWRSVAKAPVALSSHGCGNSYGHPHERTIAAVRAVAGQIYCTQLKEPEVADPEEVAGGFPDAGIALTAGSPDDLLTYRLSDSRCCGDLTVSIDRGGNVVPRSQRAAADRQHNRRCCLSPALRSN